MYRISYTVLKLGGISMDQGTLPSKSLENALENGVLNNIGMNPF